MKPQPIYMPKRSLRDRISSLLNWALMLILISSAYFTFSNRWLARDLNRWQLEWSGEGGYYPALTMLLLALPPLLLLLPVRLWLNRKSR